MRRLAALALGGTLSLAGCLVHDPAPRSGSEQEMNDVEAWRTKRYQSLKREGGWLSLVGLSWLKEGENRVGSALVSEVLLPKGAPAFAGTMVLTSGGTVTYQPYSGVIARVGGKAISADTRLKDDRDGGDADKVSVGSLLFWPIWRHGKLGVRVTDSAAPALAAFHGIDHWPVDPAWRIEARFEPAADPKKIEVPTVIPGLTEEYPVPGVAVFEKGGKEYRLEPVLETGETDFFFIFADATTGKESYPAGRFLYAKPPVDGKVVLDFNKAYNPPCAFTPYATCPLPPDQNRLDLAVTAGEKTFHLK